MSISNPITHEQQRIILHPENQQPIGLFDSGVGGLSVLSALHQLLPSENLVYVADTLYTPYGVRSTEFIQQRVRQIAEFLSEIPVKLIVVACNTATAAAVKSLREEFSIPIVGLEPALKPAIESTHNEIVGVLATQATLGSQKYRELKERYCGHAQIIEKASPLFVELVEKAGKIEDAEIALITNELQPFIDAKVDSLVLGCTHYPFLTDVIHQIMGKEVRLFESGLPVAKEVKRRLGDNLNLQTNLGEIRYCSSNIAKAYPKFEMLLGKKINLESVLTQPIE